MIGQIVGQTSEEMLSEDIGIPRKVKINKRLWVNKKGAAGPLLGK